MNRWVGDEPYRPHPCRLDGYFLVGVETGTVVPADCDTGTCEVCGVRRARARAAAITWCQRQQSRSRLITLTNCPDDWQTLRGQVRDMRRRIISETGKCEWIWTVERGSKTGMKHAHAIQHGSYLPQKTLQSLWGGRIVDVRAVHDAGQYISKSAALCAGYIGKSAGLADNGLGKHLGLNGGRLHHWSRQFWSGLSVREAVAQARGSESREEWITVWRGEDDDRAILARARHATSRVHRWELDERVPHMGSGITRKGWGVSRL